MSLRRDILTFRENEGFMIKKRVNEVITVITCYNKGKEMIIMAMKSKARKQGNSIMITIPASMNVSEGKEFFVHPGKNGNIILVPKITDPYANAKKGDFNTVLEWEDYEPQGHEVVE